MLNFNFSMDKIIHISVEQKMHSKEEIITNQEKSIVKGEK